MLPRMYRDEPNYMTKVSQALKTQILVLVDLLPSEFFDMGFEERQAVWKLVWEAVEAGERGLFTLRDIVIRALAAHDGIIVPDEGASDDNAG